MGLFRNITRRRRTRADHGPEDDFWYEGVGGEASNAGIRVTPDLALKASAVFACVRVLAETVSTLPLQMYEELPDGSGRVPAPNHPLDDLIRFQPNNWQTAVEFWEMMMLHAALRGGAYAEIRPGPRGAVDQLIPLHTDRVKAEQLSDGSLRFRVTDPHTHRERVLLQDEVFRIPGISSDGINGLRAIDLAAEAIGLGMAADAYAARVFSNNLNIGMALVHPGKLGPEAQKNLVHALMMRFAGPANSHRPMILQEGMEPKQLGQTAEQAQLIEARKWQIGEVARYWRIPLHMLNIDDQTNRSTVEAQAHDFVKYTLRPWVRRIEQAIRRDLILARGRFVAKYNLEGLLRGDSAARAAYFSAALGASGRAAWMTPNEVRRIEGMNDSDDPRADVLGGMLPSEATTIASGGGQAKAAVPQIEGQSLAARAGRLVGKEVAAIRRASMRHAGDAAAFGEWVTAFYGGHVSTVMEALGIPKAAARAYCDHVRAEVLAAGDINALLDGWLDTRAGEIAATLERNGEGDE